MCENTVIVLRFKRCTNECVDWFLHWPVKDKNRPNVFFFLCVRTCLWHQHWCSNLCCCSSVSHLNNKVVVQWRWRPELPHIINKDFYVCLRDGWALDTILGLFLSVTLHSLTLHEQNRSTEWSEAQNALCENIQCLSLIIFTDLLHNCYLQPRAAWKTNMASVFIFKMFALHGWESPLLIYLSHLILYLKVQADISTISFHGK